MGIGLQKGVVFHRGIECSLRPSTDIIVDFLFLESWSFLFTLVTERGRQSQRDSDP